MKKIVDEKGRLFGKISLIDFAFIAVVIVLAVALYLKNNVLEVTSNTTQTTSITYTMCIANQEPGFSTNLKVGDAVYDGDADSGNSIGVVTAVSAGPARSLTLTSDGTYVVINIPEKEDVLVTVEGAGIVSSGRYYVNKTYEVNANSSRKFYTKYASFLAVIQSVE